MPFDFTEQNFGLEGHSKALYAFRKAFRTVRRLRNQDATDGRLVSLYNADHFTSGETLHFIARDNEIDPLIYDGLQGLKSIVSLKRFVAAPPKRRDHRKPPRGPLADYEYNHFCLIHKSSPALNRTAKTSIKF